MAVVLEVQNLILGEDVAPWGDAVCREVVRACVETTMHICRREVHARQEPVEALSNGRKVDSSPLDGSLKYNIHQNDECYEWRSVHTLLPKL